MAFSSSFFNTNDLPVDGRRGSSSARRAHAAGSLGERRGGRGPDRRQLRGGLRAQSLGDVWFARRIDIANTFAAQEPSETSVGLGR